MYNKLQLSFTRKLFQNCIKVDPSVSLLPPLYLHHTQTFLLSLCKLISLYYLIIAYVRRLVSNKILFWNQEKVLSKTRQKIMLNNMWKMSYVCCINVWRLDWFHGFGYIRLMGRVLICTVLGTSGWFESIVFLKCWRCLWKLSTL